MLALPSTTLSQGALNWMSFSAAAEICSGIDCQVPDPEEVHKSHIVTIVLLPFLFRLEWIEPGDAEGLPQRCTRVWCSCPGDRLGYGRGKYVPYLLTDTKTVSLVVTESPL